MHWIKLGLEVFKRAWKSFPLLMRTDVWGQRMLALGPSRDIASSFASDGDSISFSMTCLTQVLRKGNQQWMRATLRRARAGPNERVTFTSANTRQEEHGRGKRKNRPHLHFLYIST